MKHIAIILAGGVGKRMGGAMPKQFLSLNDKPVIVYTLENFQRNENIDGIVVVCVEDWIEHLKEILDEYKITKVKWVVAGGDTSHDSTRNGIFFLKDKLEDGDQVIQADVPMAEMMTYANELRAMTQGRGSYVAEFSRYQAAPKEIADKVIEEAKAKQ